MYILVKGSSGLGNRILALSTALWYSRISGRKLIIDWCDGTYSEDKINAFFAYFDCPSALNIDSLPDTQSIYPQVWQNRLEQSFGGLREKLALNDTAMSVDLSRLDYSEEVIVFCAYTHKTAAIRNIFRGDYAYLAKLPTQTIISSILQEELSLKDEIKQRVAEFKTKYWTESTLGVHIRYTDLKIDLAKVYRLVEKFSNHQIFLATDSQQIREDFQRRFPKVVTTNKWFPTSGIRLHQNWTECPNRLENGQEALIDLYLLAECDRLVFSSLSSFGLVASLLSKQPKTRLFDIEKPSLPSRILKSIRILFPSF